MNPSVSDGARSKQQPQPDIVVIGAGIAGCAIAAHLAQHRSVHLLDMEEHPGYHSTGRSAAVFSEGYGNDIVRALTRESRAFFYTPPADFADAPLVTPRKILIAARHGQEEALEAFVDLVREGEQIERKSISEALALCPILRPEALVGAALSVSSADIDVDALQQGYLRLFRRRGGSLATNSPVLGLTRGVQGWTIETKTGAIRAEIIVNAAGAWAGEIGLLAGAADIGLRPLRRTACLIDAPREYETAGWPMLIDANEEFYLKPDAGKLLLSPADETVSPPGDAQPEEIDIAIAVDRLEHATTLSVRRIASKWAGLRSFVSDRSPVVGFDSRKPGFFWFAALGGYGIQTAPALSEIAADVILGSTGVRNQVEAKVDLAQIHPDRLDDLSRPHP